MRTTDSLSNASLQQLFEMNDKARRLVELMKKGIVYFIFKKKSTGKTRKAHGTLKRDLIPPEAQRKRGRPKKRPDDLVIYYDTDKNDIRSFKDELLQKVFSPKKKTIATKDEKTDSSQDANGKQKSKTNNTSSTKDKDKYEKNEK